MSFEAVKNENAALAKDAGIRSAQSVAERGVKAVLTGNCQPKARRSLSEKAIQTVVGVRGSVKDAVKEYKCGAFNEKNEFDPPDNPGGTRVMPNNAAEPNMRKSELI